MKQIAINAANGQVEEIEVPEIEIVETEPTAEELREQYERAVAQKIRRRYTSSQELAILRQKEEKPDEWQEYYDYCEQCKIDARNEISG